MTCGLPYVNGPAHIAHLRTYVPADIFVRFLRKMGQEVIFFCGSDTHGTPITVKAEAEGVTPLDIVEEYHQHFLEFFPRMGIHFTNYGSTDHPLNHNRTIQIVDALKENGYVYAKDLKLPYCPNCDRFLPDRYQRGTAPTAAPPPGGTSATRAAADTWSPGSSWTPVAAYAGPSPR